MKPASAFRALCMDTVERLVREGKTDDEAAAIIGCTAAGIRQARRRLGIYRQTNNVPNGRFTESDIMPMWLAGTSLAEIADTLGCNVKTVRRASRRLQLPQRQYVGRTWVIVGPANSEPDEKPAPRDLTGRLIATGGKWAALAEIADAEGLTMTQIQQRYHRAVRG